MFDGNALLSQTIEVIEYAKRINPNVTFVVENPEGNLRHVSKFILLEKGEGRKGEELGWLDASWVRMHDEIISLRCRTVQ